MEVFPGRGGIEEPFSGSGIDSLISVLAALMKLDVEGARVFVPGGGIDQ